MPHKPKEDVNLNETALTEVAQKADSMLEIRKEIDIRAAETIKINMNYVEKPKYYGVEVNGQSGETTKEADRSSHMRKAEVEVVLVS